jgi:hypothetical protein
MSGKTTSHGKPCPKLPRYTAAVKKKTTNLKATEANNNRRVFLFRVSPLGPNFTRPMRGVVMKRLQVFGKSLEASLSIFEV